MRILSGNSGFTLIGVLVVVGIMAALAAIVVPNMARFVGTGTEEGAATLTHTPTPTASPTATATVSPTQTPTPMQTPTPTPGPALSDTPVPGATWIRQFGSPVWDRANGVAVDRGGNIITSGATYGAMPGKTSAGSWDIFVWKVSPAGGELWSYQFGSPDSDGALAIAVDGSGNIILVGHTGGGLPEWTNAGYDDAWVRKLSPEGIEVWTRQFGSSEPDQAFGVAVDGSGNIIVVGGTMDVLPGQTSAGYEDAFVRKFSPAGVELWTRQFGSPASDRAWGVTADGSGNVIVAGRTEGVLPGQTKAGSWDAFVREFSPAGVELWTTQFGSPAPDAALAVAVDGAGNIFVAGHTMGVLPGQTSGGVDDAYVRKLSAAGAELWTRQFGTPLSDEAFAIAVDGTGNAFVTGNTAGTFPGETKAGYEDAFVQKLSPDGADLGTRQFGSPAPDVAFGVAVDGTGNIFAAGATYGAMPGQTSAGHWDAFVVRLNQPVAP